MNGRNGKASDSPRRAPMKDQKLPKESPSFFSIATTKKRKEITTLNPDDVLLGRGPGLAAYEGNMRFRELVEERKEEYTGTTQRKQKSMIAEQVRDEIYSRGGRFLQKDDDIDSVGGWYEAEDDVVIEKCKQSLREKHTYASSLPAPHPPKSDVVATKSGDETDESVFDSGKSSLKLNQSFPASVQQERPITQDHQARKRDADFDYSLGMPETNPLGAAPVPSFTISWNQAPHFPMAALSQLYTSGLPSSYIDPRVLLYQSASPLVFQQSLALRMAQTSSSDFSTLPQACTQQSAAFGTVQPRVDVTNGTLTAEEMTSARLSMLNKGPSNTSSFNLEDPAFGAMQSRVEPNSSTPTDGMLSRTESDFSSDMPSMQDDDLLPTALEALPDDTVSESFLSLFKIDSKQPRFTDDDEKKERASLTDAEQAAALADMFGKMCTVTPHQSKRSKKDLDEDSIQFLIRQMKIEIDKIPIDEKGALLNAQANGRSEEFSDTRLERFLRCEGMNAELAAKRYANYWQCRSELFRDKYLMRMTLSDALADDLAAIEDGVVTILNQRDVSGRQILYTQPNRRREGLYSSESLLRSVWYIMEVTSQQNTDISSGFVFVINHQDTTIWNYDRKAMDLLQYFEKSCWPVQCVAFHVCCPSSMCTKILKPITFKLTDKRARSRTVIHDVPPSDIVGILDEYGIRKDVLPQELGGTFRIDQKAWMADRRAIELEEIL